MLSQFLRSVVPVKPAPLIQTFSTSTIAAGTSGSINLPSGTVDGDLLYFFSSSSNMRASTPSGFTPITPDFGTKRAAWKIASSEPSSYSITTPVSADTTMIMLRIPNGQYTRSSTLGANGASPITIAGTAANVSYTLVLMLIANTSSGVTFTAPTEYTVAYQGNSAASIFVGYKIVPTSTVTAQSVTMSSGSGSGFHSIISPT